MELTGKVALVTGAGSGIGRAVSRKLGEAGASVGVVGLTHERNSATMEALRSEGVTALSVEADVRSDVALREAVARVVDELGSLSIAALCAGVEAESGRVEALAIEDYERIFDVHVKGAFLTLKHVLPAIARAGGGSVVTTSSTGGVVGFSGAPLYCAAKHAVAGLTKVAALDYAAQHVRVNGVAPSAVDTPMLERFVSGRPGVREHLAAAHPVGRIARADEIADVFLWLASDRSSYVTGQIVLADGGYTAR